MTCRVAIVGAGPAGVCCAYFLQKQFDVTLFDFSEPLRTILPTGGGRCNLSYAEYDFKEFAINYPRGEKFLYSVFSKFQTADTQTLFENLGIETYIQEDLRIFPKSDSSKFVQEKFLQAIKSCKIRKEKVENIKKSGNLFFINHKYEFEKVVVAIGGHSNFNLIKKLGHNIIVPKPSLVGLVSKDDFSELQGVSFKSIETVAKFQEKICTVKDDFVFTKDGISGPMPYKVSSIFAREDYSSENPIELSLKLISEDINLQKLLDENSKKDIKTLISNFVPKSFANYFLKMLNINSELKCYEINSKIRDKIFSNLTNFNITIIGHDKKGEVVMSGGVDLNEVDNKTMQSKLVKGLFFCGEVLDIDGFCGGFNLQNCWSSAYIAACGIMENV